MSTRLLEPRAETKPKPPPAKPSVGAVRWMERLMDTSSELYLTACRLILGGIMFAHGSQKMLGWFGGPGLSPSIQGFREHLGIPFILAVLVIFAEFFGSLALILGFVGRLGAFCISTVMVGAILLVHVQYGLFMNWTGSAPGEGFEYHLLAIGLALPILAKGSGAFSVDNWLVRGLRRERSEAA